MKSMGAWTISLINLMPHAPIDFNFTLLTNANIFIFQYHKPKPLCVNWKDSQLVTNQVDFEIDSTSFSDYPFNSSIGCVFMLLLICLKHILYWRVTQDVSWSKTTHTDILNDILFMMYWNIHLTCINHTLFIKHHDGTFNHVCMGN